MCIYGPTGVGKTDVAESIANAIPAEIINMDVGQMYSPFTIGTAKPDWINSTIKQHMFDIIHEPINYTILEYYHQVIPKIYDCLQRNVLPILVGGSGFYARSLFFPPKELEVKESQHSLHSTHNVWDTLYAIDPQRAQAIHKNDTYRIMRALDIWHTTGSKPTECVADYNPSADFILLCIMRDTDELNRRINERIHAMMKQGWIEEVRSLLNTEWEPFIEKKRLIGYHEIVTFLKNGYTKQRYNDLIDAISTKTRQYAKRQRTFWRKLERDIQSQISYYGSYIGCVESTNLTHCDIDFSSNELLQRLLYVSK